jgi:carboxylesterase
MGGLAALTLAADHGEKLDSIILAAAAVKLTTPLAPGKPLNFITPFMRIIFKKWNVAQDHYADKSLAQYNTNYLWAPIDAILSFFEFSKATRNRLAEVKTPALIIQSHNDSTVAPESAEIINNRISTPAAFKRIVWFEITDHEMFRDSERYAIIDVIANYVRERTGTK